MMFIEAEVLILAGGVTIVGAFLGGFFLNGYLAAKNDEKIPFKEDV